MLVTLMTEFLYYAREWETSLCIAMSVTCVVYVLWRPRWISQLREALTGLRIHADLNSSPTTVTVSEGRGAQQRPRSHLTARGPARGGSHGASSARPR